MSAILVTGATDGLGRALAAELVAAGHEVLVHGRSQERIDATLAELDPTRARGYLADLSSLAAVRGLATDVREREQRLDVLVNNAGIGADGPRAESADGLELRFAVNYLAGYVLTRELLGLLRASAAARIVNVASAGQQALDFGDLQLERDYSGVRAYCQSKLAQVLFTFDLAAELDGSGVTATALHPATYMPTKMVATPASTLQEGVDATLRLVLAPELDGVSGAYFNGQREARAHEQAYDPAARRALREASAALAAQ